MTEDHPSCSRRALVGAAAMTLAGSTAGCLSLLPPVGQQVRFGRVDVPGPTDTEPRYRRWIPAQHEIPDLESDRDHEEIHWVSATPGNLGGDELGATFDIARALVMSQIEYVGYDLEHYDFAHGIGSLGAVVEGDIERSVVTETALEGGYSRDGTYYDWTLFDRTDNPRTVAVSDSAVVITRGEHRRTFIETLLDAGDGRIERYHEANERFAAFSSRVGTYPEMLEQFGYFMSPMDPEHAVMTYNFDEDGAYLTYHQQYADGETPTRGEIERYVEEEHDRARSALSVDIQIDDTYVRTELRIHEDEFADGGTTDRKPHVMWSFEDTGGTVTIRLEAGDSIPVDQLAFEPAGVLVEEFASGTVLEPGDEFAIDIDAFPADEDRFSVIYNYAGTDHSSASLLQYTPDELDTE